MIKKKWGKMLKVYSINFLFHRTPLKEYVLYTRLNVDSYGWPLGWLVLEVVTVISTLILAIIKVNIYYKMKGSTLIFHAFTNFKVPVKCLFMVLYTEKVMSPSLMEGWSVTRMTTRLLLHYPMPFPPTPNPPSSKYKYL